MFRKLILGLLALAFALPAQAQTIVYGYSPTDTQQNVADVQALVVRPNSLVLLGTSTPGDGGGGIFYWSPDNTTAPDNVSVIQPTNGPAGRYIRLPFSSLGGVAGGDLSGTYPNPQVVSTHTVPFGVFATGTSAANLTGNLSVLRLNNGTGASSSTFWRGDGTWANPGGSGTINTGTSGQLAAYVGTTTIGSVAIAGDCTFSTPNLTCNKTSGVSFGGYATISAGALTASLTSDVLLNNAANYFDGPQIAQGTSGTWSVSGTVTISDVQTQAGISCKLWDGTTVIAASQLVANNVTAGYPMALSGIITNPANNLRISCKDISTTNGIIRANITGNGNKDSTISAHRIN